MPEPIDQLVVELVGDASKLLESIEKAVSEGESRLSEMAQVVKEAWGGVAGEMLITESLAEALGVSFQEARAVITDALAGSSDALDLLNQGLARAGELVSEDRLLTAQAFQAMAKEAKDAGMAIDSGLVAAMVKATEEARRLGEGLQGALARFREYAAEARAAGAGTRDTGEQSDFASRTAAQFSQGLGALAGRLAKVASAAYLVNRAIGEFSAQTRKAEAEAMRLSDTEMRLDVVTRAAQRAMGDAAVTAREWNALGRELADTFGNFSVAAVEELGVKASMLQRQLRIPHDEMLNLVRATYILAAVTGKDLTEAWSNITYAIQYGYTRGLKSLLVDVDAIERAEGKRWGQMSQAERVLALNNYLTKEAAVYAEDLAAAQGTLAAAQDRINRKAEESRAIWGNLVLLIKTKLGEIWVNIVNGFLKKWLDVAEFIGENVSGVLFKPLMAFIGFVAALPQMLEAVKAGQGVGEVLRNAIESAWRSAGEEWEKTLDWLYTGVVEGFGRLEEAAADGAESVGAALGELPDNVEQAFEGLFEVLREAEEQMAEATERLGERYEDIERDLARKREDIETDLARDLEDIDVEAARRRAEVTADFHYKEQWEAEQHRLRMLELENRYLLDLEDAVRERDARQVLLLQRRYNLERQEAEDQYNLDSERRRADFLRELADIQLQRERKRQERFIEYQQELADAALAAQRRREDALLSYQRELQDIAQVRDAKLKELAEAYAAEIQLNAQAQAQLRAQLNQHFGAQMAAIDQFFSWYAARLAQLQQAITATRLYSERWESEAPFRRQSAGFWSRVHGYQYGGTLLATGPTLMQVGEARPERVDITPLSQAALPAAPARGGHGRVEISIALDDGLTGRIVEDTLAEVADVVLSVAGRAGGAR